MSFEILLVSGFVLGVLSIVAVLNALIEGHRPRVAAISVVVSGALLIAAVNKAEEPLEIRDIPRAFVHVVGKMIQ